MTGSLTDHLGVPVPSALPAMDAQEGELLRMLGRLEYLTVEQIQVAFFRHLTLATVHERLAEMLEDGLVWRTRSRFMHIPKSPGKARSMAAAVASPKRERLKRPFVYGLTDEGKQLLLTLELEKDEETISRLRSWNPHAKKRPKKKSETTSNEEADALTSAPPDARTLGHDLQVSWWAWNVILEAARNRLCRGIYAQVEFISEKRQRIDGMIILRFSLTRPRRAEEIGAIPWFDGTPVAPDEIDIRLALEVDRGTEALRILLEKGAAYRDLTLDGVYTTLFGGPVLPVFLVQTDQQDLGIRRVRQIATEFRDIWPGGLGVISTPIGVTNQDAGVLWGQYKTLADAQPFPLLTELRVDPASGRVSFVPLCDLATWLSYRVDIPVALSAEQLAGQAGARARWSRVVQEAADQDSEAGGESDGAVDKAIRGA